MAKYDYKCEICGSIKELEMGMKEEHPKVIYCEKCNKDSMKRFFGKSVGAIHIPFQWGDETPLNFEKRKGRHFHSFTDRHNKK